MGAVGIGKWKMIVEMFYLRGRGEGLNKSERGHTGTGLGNVRV